MSGFHHEAVFYASTTSTSRACCPTSARPSTPAARCSSPSTTTRTRLLRDALGADAARVRFTDMERLGRNPACIIPAWREFMATAGSGPRLGIGEPVWPGRSAAELVECRRHESLLNLAFDGGAAGGCCARTTSGALEPDVLADARRNHPHVSRAASACRARTTSSRRRVLSWDGALPPPAAAGTRSRSRATTSPSCAASSASAPGGPGSATSAGPTSCWPSTSWPRTRCATAAVAASLSVWQENGTLLCEVADQRPHRRSAGRPRAPARCARRRPRAVARQPPLRPRADAHLAGRERGPPAHEPRRRRLVPVSAPVVGGRRRAYAEGRPQ